MSSIQSILPTITQAIEEETSQRWIKPFKLLLPTRVGGINPVFPQPSTPLAIPLFEHHLRQRINRAPSNEANGSCLRPMRKFSLHNPYFGFVVEQLKRQIVCRRVH